LTISRTSRYNYTPVLRVTNASGYLTEREHFDIRPTLVRIAHSDNTELAPASSDTWSRIAWRTLGDGQLYWVICDFSQIIDPLSELKPEIKTKYLAQLAADVPAGTKNQITVTRARDFIRGQKIRIESLDPAALVSVDTFVQGVNPQTGLLQVNPFTSVIIPNAMSRVSLVFEKSVRLTIPNIHRALFDALDFGNPLSILGV
jgi:hypothetical protein